MNRIKIIAFLTLTFSWSWISWLNGLECLSHGLNKASFENFLVFFFIGLYGPTISGIITALLFDGPSGLIQVLKKFLIWKTPFKYYLYIIILPIIFVVIGILLFNLLVGEIGVFDKMAFLSIPTVLFSGIYAGPLGEELGWRGFLLPELQKGFSNLKSAIIIGVIWFIWHIPLWWAPFGTLVSGEPISLISVFTYFIIIVCLSIIITWLVISTRGSILIAILFHLSINSGIALLFFPDLNVHIKFVHLLSAFPMIVFVTYLITSNKLSRNTIKQ